MARETLAVIEGKLSDRDASMVLDVVASLADADSIDVYAMTVMAGLAELIECIDVSYNEMNRVEERVRWMSLPDQGDLLTHFAPVFERYMRQNPLVAHFEDTGDTLSLIHISEPTRPPLLSRMPSSA